MMCDQPMFITCLLASLLCLTTISNSLTLLCNFNRNNTLMAINCYTREDLLALRPSRVNYKLCDNVFFTVKDCGILRHTRRGPKRSLINSNKPHVYTIDNITPDRPIHDGQGGKNVKNLISIKPVITYINSNVNKFCFAVVNTRSLCNKVTMFIDYMVSARIDLCVVTETWLSDVHEDIRADFREAGFILDDAPRQGRRGGGLAVIHRKNISHKRLRSAELSSFEYVEWQIKHKDFSILLVAIYRPPYSEAHPVTLNTFLHEFRCYAEGVCATSSHILNYSSQETLISM